MFSGLLNNPVLWLLPFLIIIHIVVGTWAAIKKKRFELKCLSDFMSKGLVFYGFLLILDVTYSGIVDSDLGSFAITGVQTLRGVAWLAIVCYYLAKIYGNLVEIGMPRLTKLEVELNKNSTEVTAPEADSEKEENDV